MKTQEWYNTRDKSGWGDGPWQSEPDKMQWRDEATGLPCLIVRNGSGALCGYVGVDQRHPYFERDYNDIDAEVHGGLTFADRCVEDGKEHGICHIVEPGEDDQVWWLGFDCAHSMDYVPGMMAREQSKAVLGLGIKTPYGLTYRDVAYVKSEIAELARQLKEQA